MASPPESANPQSPHAESRQIGPVELEEIDGAIVRASTQGDARRLVQRVAVRQLEASEQVIIQREAEIVRARICGGGGRRLPRPVKNPRGSPPPPPPPQPRRRARPRPPLGG